MFAIIQAGGKQYSVKPGDIIEVNRMEGNVGDTLSIAEILFLGGDKPKMGKDIGAATVAAEIVAHNRGEKIIVFKKKRRQNYRRKNGHKQHLTTLKIGAINA